MSNKVNEISDALLSIYEMIESFRLEREKTELYDSNRFNPFQFMRTDEMGLSVILAFLLDPKEKHGQGDLFLNSFLKYIGKHSFLAYDSVEVSVEKATKYNRRHDIMIEGYLNGHQKWIISIENKLRFASDQNEQLKDYRDDLISKKLDFCLIYLPVFEQKPSNSSIKENEWLNLERQKKAVLISAQDLINWLERTVIVAPAIKQFCCDFIKFLSEELMGHTETKDDLVNYLLDEDNSVELYSALTVIDSKEQLYDSLTNKLVKQLQKIFEDNYKKLSHYGWKCNSNGEVFDKDFGIYFDKEDICFGVGIQFDKANLCNGYYGVYCHKSEHEVLHDFLVKVLSDENLRDDFKSSKWWAKWKWLEGDLLSWNAETLRKIPTGELAEILFDLFKPFLDVITENLAEIEKLETTKS